MTNLNDDSYTSYDNAIQEAESALERFKQAANDLHNHTRLWGIKPSKRVGIDCIFDADGRYVCQAAKCDAELICDAVNLKTRIDEAMADEAGYLHPVVLDGKPMVCVTPPLSEAEESRIHREYETNLLVEREWFRRSYYEAVEKLDSLRDIIRRLCQMCSEDWTRTNEAARRALLHEAREAIGEDGK